MSDKYNVIQQRQPLRVPDGWTGTEKAFVIQLDEIFDDIYRRYGRLRLQDMDQSFRNQIADDEGNIADLTLDVSGLTTRVGTAEGNISTLTLDVSGLTTRVGTAEGNIGSLTLRCDGFDVSIGNKYDKISGISITADGIDVTGSKYVKIRSGSRFDVESDNMIIDSENGYMTIVREMGYVPFYYTIGEDTNRSSYDYYSSTNPGVTYSGDTTVYPLCTKIVDKKSLDGYSLETTIRQGTNLAGGEIVSGIVLDVYKKNLTTGNYDYTYKSYFEAHRIISNELHTLSIHNQGNTNFISIHPNTLDSNANHIVLSEYVNSGGTRIASISSSGGASTMQFKGNADTATKLSRAPTYGELSGR